VLAEMHGSERAEELCRRWRQMCPDFERYLVEFGAGDIWGRPGLDRRTKTLITIAVLTVLGRPLALEHNIRKAPNNGVSREEIVEAMLHLTLYAGFPAAWEGLQAAQRIFGEADETSNPHTRKRRTKRQASRTAGRKETSP
jgi:4-carboxymuconolactone decarboxylase